MRTPKQLFNEIVKLAESAIKEDEVKDVEVQEEVVLAEEVQQEEVDVQEELAEEPMQEESVKEPLMDDYVKRSEFDSAMKEMKEMYTKVLEVMSPEASEDVPSDLAQDDSITEELSAQEDTDTLVHTPDAQVEEKKMHLYAQGRKKTTEDYVFQSLFNK